MLKMSVKLLNVIQAFLLITFASQIHSWKDGTNCRKSDYYNLSTMEWDLTLNKGFPIDIVLDLANCISFALNVNTGQNPTPTELEEYAQTTREFCKDRFKVDECFANVSNHYTPCLAETERNSFRMYSSIYSKSYDISCSANGERLVAARNESECTSLAFQNVVRLCPPIGDIPVSYNLNWCNAMEKPFKCFTDNMESCPTNAMRDLYISYHNNAFKVATGCDKLIA